MDTPAGTDMDTEQPVWLFAYFRQIYPDRVEVGPEGVYAVPLTDQVLQIEALHYAWSRDGLRWTALNNNQPVQPAFMNGRSIRDPYIQRAPDGRFHLLATGGLAPRHLLHASSENLIDWSPLDSVPVMESVAEAQNVWAPEWVYDDRNGQFLVFWSSSMGRFGWDASAIWCAHTSDFGVFSEPRVMFDPGFSVIDATIAAAGGRFYMFFKEERFGSVHGERRRIFEAVAATLDGPYEMLPDAVTTTITEGPAVFFHPPAGEWRLVYDRCMEDSYAAATSRDLLHWEPAGTEFPPNARHGSVLRISEAELDALKNRFNGSTG